ncbi:hypothetical protein Taro_032793 [Colocasia esculenta]|uniref:Uncharacterized protein n=1 Tax=Colocasia esculenta TaxID=4460 RepID=A0A843VS78_COLES|nr:hypothetical protein [Colocasia esculenta]
MQDREAAQRQTAELRNELERVRGAGVGGASSSRSAGGSPSLLEARLAGAVLRAEEAQRHLEERVRERFAAHHRARDGSPGSEGPALKREGSAAYPSGGGRGAGRRGDEGAGGATGTEAARRPKGDHPAARGALAQQTLARSLQQIVTDIGRSRSRSRSSASVSRATGASVRQYLEGSSSRRRNEEEERRWQGEGSAQDGRGGGEMLPPPDRREGSRESGGGQ